MNWYKKYIYANITAYTLDELLYKFKMFGVVMKREAGGSHFIYFNTNNGLTTTVPVGPGSKIINPETMKEMLMHLDIPWGIWKALPKAPRKKDMRKIEEQLPWNVQEEEEIEPPQKAVPAWQNSQWYQQQNRFTSPSEENI